MFMGRIGLVNGLPETPEAAPAGATCWPNPAHEQVWLRPPFGAATTTATIFDATGRPVKTVALTADPQPVAVADLPAGVYVVRFQAARQQQAVRLVVQR